MENMAKKLNIYRSGPQGEAARAQGGGSSAGGSTPDRQAERRPGLPPLRLTLPSQGSGRSTASSA